jgi:O-antigen/teichoic acid export membrane protein
MFRDLRWVSLAEAFSRVVSVVTVPLLTRALVPADYGLYKSVITAFSLLLLFEGTLNLDTLLQKRVPERDDSGPSLVLAAGLLSVVVLVFAIGLLAVATMNNVFAIFSPAVQRFITDNFAIVALLMGLTAFHRLGFSALRAVEAFVGYAAIRVSREVIVLLSVITGFLLGALTVQLVMLIYIIANAAVVVAVLVALRERLSSLPDTQDLGTQLRSVSIPLAPKPLLKQAQSRVPDLLVLTAFSTAVFGRWVVVFGLAGLIAVFNKPVSQLLLPKLSGRLDRGEPVDAIVLTYYRVMLLLALPTAAGGVLIGPQIIRYAFGAAYVPPGVVVAVLLTGFAVKPVAALSGYFYIATGRSDLESLNSVIGTGIYLGGATIGALILDSLVVIAVTFTLQYVVRLAIALAYQRHYVNFSIPTFTTCVSVGLALLIMSGVVSIIEGRIGSFPMLIGVVVTGTVVYFAVLCASGFFSSRDIILIRRFIGMD